MGYHSLFLPVLHPASRNTLVIHLKQDSGTHSQVLTCLAVGPPSARKHSLSRLESTFTVAWNFYGSGSHSALVPLFPVSLVQVQLGTQCPKLELS